MSTSRSVAVGHPHANMAGSLGTVWPFASATVTGGTIYADEHRSVVLTSPVKLDTTGVFRFFAAAGTYTVTYTHPVTGATAVETITVA